MTAPLDEPAFVSPAGAPWMVEYDLDPDKGEALRRALPGRPWTLWRYRELLPVADFAGRVDLGEGATPLIRLRRFAPEGVELWLKDESGNPTGSFKARGLSLAVNRARELGAPGVQLASAGNAALALTAYAAAAGLPARVALPADTPRTVFERCREYGAEVLSGPGTLVEAAKLLEEGKERFWGLSTLREPYRAEGKKTMGLELAEQFGWELPDWIVYPLGGGTGIVGMHKAFAELRAAGADRPQAPALRGRPGRRLRADRARLGGRAGRRRAVGEPGHPGLGPAGAARHRRLPGPPGPLPDRRQRHRGGREAPRRRHRLDRRARGAADRARGGRRAGRGRGSGGRRSLRAGRAGGGLPDRRSRQLCLSKPLSRPSPGEGGREGTGQGAGG